VQCINQSVTKDMHLHTSRDISRLRPLEDFSLILIMIDLYYIEIYFCPSTLLLQAFA